MADEEQPKQDDRKEEKPTQPPAPIQEDKSARSLIYKATEAAERLEQANKRMEMLIAKQEAMRVEQTLGGQTYAGNKQEKTQEEKEIESARKMLEGTGYEDMFDEPKKK